MKDWNALARVADLEVADPRTLAPLESLEAAFRPLVERLTPLDDVAVDFAAALKEEGQ